ncbi:hypothetical protein C479_15672 [Halovivax asiaticus JCM 14624]|uniref:Uncharacterized protein n=1 Tax=Halovivax asiaticus JCM 14624 TaxID=1227490 RepID=M0B9U9_9EURY|nr:hypothetical protein [Halovivax asiaticus]ELZ07058.1 hypothetical protein C479_15672 [Halovivax asiaticus JCM 14624]
MTARNSRPSTVAGSCALGAGLVGVVVAGLGSIESAAIAVAGFGLLVWAVRRGGSVALDLGSVILFLALVHGTSRTASMGGALVGSLAVVLAWDFAHTARDIGRQLGRDSQTKRLEVVRISTSALAGLVPASVGYLVFLSVGSVGSVGALVALVLSILFVTVALGTGVSSVRSRTGDVFRDV